MHAARVSRNARTKFRKRTIVLDAYQRLVVVLKFKDALGIADNGLVLNLGKVVAEDDAATLAADVGLRRHYLGF